MEIYTGTKSQQERLIRVGISLPEEAWFLIDFYMANKPMARSELNNAIQKAKRDVIEHNRSRLGNCFREGEKVCTGK